MDGSSGTSGVTLISGSGIFAGDSITLVNGARQMRIRLPSTKESVENKLIIEVKNGTSWQEIQSFIVV